jgi:hypothetical protein
LKANSEESSRCSSVSDLIARNNNKKLRKAALCAPFQI